MDTSKVFLTVLGFVLILIVGFYMGYQSIRIFNLNNSQINKHQIDSTLSLPGPQDVILDNITPQQEFGKIYYYQQFDSVSSTLNGKIIDIDLSEKTILIGDSGQKTLIYLDDNTEFDQIFSNTGQNRKFEGDINTLNINDQVSVSMIRYVDNKYYAGRVAIITIL